MPKTKPQAEKRKEREEQIAEQAKLRAEEAQRKRETYQSHLKRDENNSDDDTKAMVVSTQPKGRARLVMNHNTHIEGLIELLRLVCIKLDSRFTITPGAIHSNQSLSTKKGGLSFRTQRSDTDDTLRLLAMNGGSAQEVFISVPEGYDGDKLQGIIEDCLERREALYNESDSDDDKALNLINTNRQMAKERANEWKEDHKAHHERVKAIEAEAEEQREVEARERTLRTKVGSEQAEAYAERDEDIVKGRKRGKYAMK
jgi:hypothetical protein